ncbi:hypothetical protein [uncultured Hyphomicrobium sp.]|uniref:hypothetical protein n=1 Tax=uncultured Hyphomicrobium sp. TaxID=194373 RepID=UPI0025FC9EF3|nr:hypothetical protein [uncultured Hyphomicrobium sp.]
MTPSTLIKSTSARAAFVAVVLTGALTSQAGAVSLGVKLACASDYYSYCSQHPVGSTAVRQCMRSHGAQLSKRCVSALIGAGEVSQAEVNRRRAAKAGKAVTASAQ